MAKVRVKNPNNYVVLAELSNGVTKTFKPHSFFVLDQDEVEILAATTTFFSNGHLEIDDEKVVEEIGLDKEEVKTFTDEDIRKILKGKVSDFHKFIDESIGNLGLIIKIREVAEKEDLPASKIKYMNEKLDIDVIAM